MKTTSFATTACAVLAFTLLAVFVDKLDAKRFYGHLIPKINDNNNIDNFDNTYNPFSDSSLREQTPRVQTPSSLEINIGTRTPRKPVYDIINDEDGMDERAVYGSPNKKPAYGYPVIRRIDNPDIEYKPFMDRDGYLAYYPMAIAGSRVSRHPMYPKIKQSERESSQRRLQRLGMQRLSQDSDIKVIPDGDMDISEMIIENPEVREEELRRGGPNAFAPKNLPYSTFGPTEKEKAEQKKMEAKRDNPTHNPLNPLLRFEPADKDMYLHFG